MVTIMEIKVQVIGMNKLLDKIRKNAKTITDLTPFWHSVGQYMIKRTIKNFEHEQSPEGIKWTPLSLLRIKQRKKRHKGGRIKILSDTGELRRSVAYKAFSDKAVFGSNLIYAKTHQFGRGNIPARPFLGVTDEDKNKVLSMMRSYIKRNF